MKLITPQIHKNETNVVIFLYEKKRHDKPFKASTKHATHLAINANPRL
jgi:hypothetical protein